MDTQTTETALMATNNKHIELQIVHGETSGLLKISRDGSVELSDDVSYEQWCEMLAAARIIYNKSAVVIADLIAFGLAKWDKVKVDTALEQLEFEAIMVKSAIAISTVPKALRHENLDPDHYVELAKSGLARKDQAKWAKIASDQHLTPSQLRYSIVEGEVVDRAAAKQQQTGVLTIQGIRQQFDVWLRRVHGLDGVKTMDADHKAEILDEIAPICEFGMQLNEHMVSLQSVNVA